MQTSSKVRYVGHSSRRLDEISGLGLAEPRSDPRTGNVVGDFNMGE